ncbi:hypothetical protein FQA39_LY00720 [Lamprigera yunnana]|nr:hypothetical protein FQA39_LY00720 [Lamprigera yunnana]
MDRFSRSFKIISALNKLSKENQGTEKKEQGTSVILNLQDDISKCDKISEGSELSLVIRKLKAECNKTEKLLETDDDGNFNIITAEIIQAVKVQSRPFGHTISIEDTNDKFNAQIKRLNEATVHVTTTLGSVNLEYFFWRAIGDVNGKYCGTAPNVSGIHER